MGSRSGISSGSSPDGTRRVGRLLMVEANPINAFFAAREVEELGFEAFVVETGEEALRLAAEGSFDIVLLDRGLADTDLGDLAARWADVGTWRRPRPALYFASAGDIGEREEETLRRAGFAGIIQRPLRGLELAGRLIERLWPGAEADEGP